MEYKPKSIDSLMKIMRDDKKININGSIQKRKLRCMGYFHGYKGYRYCNSPTSQIKYSDFNQIQAVYDFDMQLKTLLYPRIMFIETAMKNYALEIILKEAGSGNFSDIFTKILNDYKSFRIGTAEYKKALMKRLTLRNRIFSAISNSYDHKNIVNHYYDNDRLMPVWAIFELLSLGEFGNFIASLNIDVRQKISGSIGIQKNFDSNGKMIQNIVFALKDLRNAVAHNNTIFDTRFSTGNIGQGVSKYLKNETNIKDIKFNSIADYIVLIVVLMKHFNCSKNETMAFVQQFEKACEDLRKAVPIGICTKIIFTDTKSKIGLLKKYI